jgi:hypothetical protein
MGRCSDNEDIASKATNNAISFLLKNKNRRGKKIYKSRKSEFLETISF